MTSLRDSVDRVEHDMPIFYVQSADGLREWGLIDALDAQSARDTAARIEGYESEEDAANALGLDNTIVAYDFPAWAEARALLDTGDLISDDEVTSSGSAAVRAVHAIQREVEIPSEPLGPITREDAKRIRDRWQSVRVSVVSPLIVDADLGAELIIHHWAKSR